MSILIGVTDFFLHPYKYHSFYRKEYLSQSAVVTNEVLYDIINGLPENLKSAPKFRSLKAKLITNDKKDTRLKMTIEIYEKMDLDSVIRSVVEYVNSLPALREKFEFMKMQDRQLIDWLTNKIATCGNGTSPIENTGCMVWIEKKQKAEKELALNKIINCIEISPEFVYVSNTRTGVLYIVGCSLLGILVGCLAGFIPGLIRQIK
jgi:hypothetical protein